ncbi:MAG: hypothetical protein ACJ8GJ_11105 [Vitreoscilla sp.]
MPHTPKRVVPVAVDVTAAADGTVTIDCSPSPADIIKGTSHALLVFTLNTTGYRFRTAHAITLDKAVDDFPYPSWTISDTQAALYDCNKVADTIDYTVTVVNTTTGQEYSVDPEIKNGGSGTGGN